MFECVLCAVCVHAVCAYAVCACVHVNKHVRLHFSERCLAMPLVIYGCIC